MVSFRSHLAAFVVPALAGLTLLSHAEPAKAGTTNLAIVGAWLNAQTNIQTWTADVTQIRSLKTLTQPLIATGQVWFAAPNRFRWEIGRPAQTIAVRKSDEMLVIYPRLKRAERYSFASQASGPWKDTLALLEAGFPRDEADLNRQFTITSVTISNQVCHLNLQPKSVSARHIMPQLGISFSTNDFVLRTTELHFADGSTMRNEFSQPTLNSAIDQKQFAPELPPDYKIVEPMGSH